ncbi:hypothetical protein [Chroococcidiopsis sp.]|uniref:hypothetical protein n=1 Tax=Chroococcidiopsis sp. TaxID=3088168 RepID=UPI003F2A36E3
MDLYILNLSTKERINLQYIDPNVTIGSINATYSNADIPGRVTNLRYWQKSDYPVQSLIVFLNGKDTQTTIDKLRTLCKPTAKLTPPELAIKIGEKPAFNAVMISVTPEFDLSMSVRFERAKVTLGYLPNE